LEHCRTVDHVTRPWRFSSDALSPPCRKWPRSERKPLATKAFAMPQLESIVSVWLRSDQENATARITQSSLSSEMKARLLLQKE
jgi:hypothetical protein